MLEEKLSRIYNQIMDVKAFDNDMSLTPEAAQVNAKTTTKLLKAIEAVMSPTLFDAFLRRFDIHRISELADDEPIQIMDADLKDGQFYLWTYDPDDDVVPTAEADFALFYNLQSDLHMIVSHMFGDVTEANLLAQWQPRY